MTRVVSYNILAGGYDMRNGGQRRSTQIIKMLRAVDPDVVGVVEALHPSMKESPTVLEEIATELGMQIVAGGACKRPTDYQLALLTRLPIVSTKIS